MPNRVFVGSETFPKDVGYNWERVMKYPNLLGDFTWTGMEYLGEAGIARHEYEDASPLFYGPYPHYYSGSGDISLTGDRLPISYYREVVFGLRKAPYIAVWRPETYGRPHKTSVWGWSDTLRAWRFPGFEGKPVAIEVYSGAEEVELLVNGESLGRKPLTECRTQYDAMYAPGEVVAVSYEGGVETGRDVLKTAGESLRLQISVDKGELAAGAQDLAHIAFELTDDEGLRRTDADRRITLSVEGAGELAGFGCDDPLSEEGLCDSAHNTYRGRALAFIRSSVEPGTIRISVACEGFETQCFELQVK